MGNGWYSAQELAGMPGMPGTERRVRARLENFLSMTRAKERGKGLEYPLSCLPEITRAALIERHLADVPPAGTNLPAVLPATSPSPTSAGLLIPQASADLTDKQRAERDARTVVLTAIRNLQARSGCSKEAAMHTMLTLARSGKTELGLDAMLRQARDPRGRAGDGYPSIRTLKRWLSAPDLAPRVAQKEMAVPPWAPALMKLYGRPTKPALSACMDDLPAALPDDVKMPSYAAAARLLRKLGNVERHRGRMLPRELKNLLPFVRRDTSGMTPDAIYTADGHTFDAEVANPRHGKAFRPEITTVLSVPTRRCIGWSAGLAESTLAVMDALRHAVETCGIPVIWYVDNGTGFKNIAMTAEVTGFVGRIGCTIAHSLPYNSQARGVEERSHRSIWVRAAKKLPTYMGADMDRQARQKVYKLTRSDLKATGASPLLMAWDKFLAFCQEEIDAYNNRPHRALPQLRDPATGKLRHQTPNEAWQAAIDAGWSPMAVTAEESADLFRPEVVATTVRGEVRCNGNLYFSRELTEYTGDQVRVGYDIHDAGRVWVRDMEGRLICIAEFEANKRRHHPESFIEQAARRRAEAREKRLEAHLQEVREELDAPALLEHQQAITIPLDIPAAPLAIEGEAHRIGDNVISLPGLEQRPWFTNDPDQYRWLMRNPARWTAEDAAWLLDYVVSEDCADLAARYEFQGVAWCNDDEARARDKLDSEVAAR